MKRLNFIKSAKYILSIFILFRRILILPVNLYFKAFNWKERFIHIVVSLTVYMTLFGKIHRVSVTLNTYGYLLCTYLNGARSKLLILKKLLSLKSNVGF